MLKSGPSICWYLTVHSDKIDLGLTKTGIFKSWLVTGKDSIFQIFSWNTCKCMDCPWASMGKIAALHQNEWLHMQRRVKWGKLGPLQERVPTEVIAEKRCCLAASLRREGWITLQLCRNVRLKITKWVSLSLTQADCKYYKILSGCSLQ